MNWSQLIAASAVFTLCAVSQSYTPPNMGGAVGCVVTKIDRAFENAEKVESTNSTVPPMPLRPNMPQFCSGGDTTLYIFGGCTIQNNKVYVGKTLARELNAEEKTKMAVFIEKMAKQTKEGTAPSADLHKGLDFCTDL